MREIRCLERPEHGEVNLHWSEAKEGDVEWLGPRDERGEREDYGRWLSRRPV